VAPTIEPTVSRMTIVTEGDTQTIEQIAKQLNRLVDVIKVLVYSDNGKRSIEHELALIKVNIRPETSAELLNICNIFHGKVIDLSRKTCTIEVCGEYDKIEAMIELLKPSGIQEVVRTGRVAISRGPTPLKEESV
jgi:acetolactate synthase-1/3 small subunit